MTQLLRIAVADDERDTREYLQEWLTRLGHQVMAVRTGRELVELCNASPPDLVITDVKMPDMDGIAAAEAINRERETPVILISAYHEAELLGRATAVGNVMGYLLKPVASGDVEAAVALATHRFEQHQASRQEASDLRQALEGRKVIERAKGVLMKRLRLDEQEAFRCLKRLASGTNRKLAQVAEEVFAADEVFRQLEGDGG